MMPDAIKKINGKWCVQDFGKGCPVVYHSNFKFIFLDGVNYFSFENYDYAIEYYKDAVSCALQMMGLTRKEMYKLEGTRFESLLCY